MILAKVTTDQIEMKTTIEKLTPSWFRGKKITVMGLGVNEGGLGVAKWLLRHGARLTVTDLKSRAALAVSVEALMHTYQKAIERSGGNTVYRPKFVFGRHEESDFIRADLVVRNPAVPDDNYYLAAANRAGVRVEMDIAIFFLLCPVPIIGISGTKGKSTVTTLLGEIVKRYDRRAIIAGNIRRSPFDDLDRLIRSSNHSGHPIPVILELSSWHLDGLEKHQLSPHIGVLTNVLEDHLNRYNGLADYARSKSLLLAFQSSGDFAVVNADDARVVKFGTGHQTNTSLVFGGQRFPFSIKPLKGDGCFVRKGQVVLSEQGIERSVMSVSDIPLLGNHNLSNVLAAYAAARKAGVPIRIISTVIKNFYGVPGRLELVGEVGGVKYINDTTATVAEASIRAIEAFATQKSSRIILLAGGADKKLKYGEWGRTVKRLVKSVVLFRGTATPKLERALKTAGFRGEVILVDSMAEAVQSATNLAQSNDTILLSPACASFGLFINEFDRGDQFVGEVRKLVRHEQRSISHSRSRSSKK
ncbi:TPA: UDP-N-acetylmuramoyl-L-alanine--D-glutamate ligase [Candidatus Uhrbacteria bacterium]|nr:UDP-N-acetylmuramoyl-L-alanine--D-glutamate ligase [Candidatus Uhrbacteria bacterium]